MMRILSLIVCLLGPVANAWGALGCGELANPFGPYDYTDRAHRAQHLPIVETNHFTAEIQRLERGATGTMGGDIDYTLRAFPNHHLALQAMMRLAKMTKTPKPAGAHYSVECYFDRALRFKGDDPVVLMLHGMFLNGQNKLDDAIAQVEKANQLQPNDANINYNLGLLYFEKKNFAKSKEHAKIAYDLGFPLPGLKNKLSKAGQWE